MSHKQFVETVVVTEFQSESWHTIHYTHDEILEKSSCINLEQKYLFSGSANHKMRSFYPKCGQDLPEWMSTLLDAFHWKSRDEAM